MDSFSNALNRFQILNFATTRGGCRARTPCGRQVIAFWWPCVPPNQNPPYATNCANIEAIMCFIKVAYIVKCAKIHLLCGLRKTWANFVKERQGRCNNEIELLPGIRLFRVKAWTHRFTKHGCQHKIDAKEYMMQVIKKYLKVGHWKVWGGHC